jgi:murein DD-endopeptidase MepM/ murein hydrolase activator NlpD
MEIVYPGELHGGRIARFGILSDAKGTAGMDLVLTIRDGSGRRVVSSPFFPASGPDGDARDAALLGLPSTISDATYRVILESGELTIWEGASEGVSGTFRKEDISLNYDMTVLRSEPDPRKTEEAVMIQQIYASFKPRKAADSAEFILPVENGRYTSWYGDRRRFIYADGSVAHSLHSGVDIAAPTGTPVIAGAEGVVVFAGERIVTGQTVVVEHLPGLYGIFFHLDSIDVRQGEAVSAETLIGSVGMSGLATGPHLHWEIRAAGVPVDPLLLLADKGLQLPGQLDIKTE